MDKAEMIKKIREIIGAGQCVNAGKTVQMSMVRIEEILTILDEAEDRPVAENIR